MARPQLAEGYAQLALELIPALLACGLSSYDGLVLAEILVQQYGPRKRMAAIFSPAEYQCLTGIDHHNMRRSIKNLVRYGMIRPVGSDGIQFAFVADWESWQPPLGKLSDRLGGALKRVIRSTLERFGHKHASGSTQTPRARPAGSIQTPDGPREGSIQTPDSVAPLGGRGGIGTAGAPASEDPEKKEPEEGAGGARLRTIPFDEEKYRAGRLADRVVGEVFGLRDSAGNPDHDQAAMLACWIGTASDAAVMAAAHKAKLKAKGDPISFLVGMCRKGLEEPGEVPPPRPAPRDRDDWSAQRVSGSKPKRVGSWTPPPGQAAGGAS
jgi:hypothetical protein